MLPRLRNFIVAFAVAGMLVGHAAPAFAGARVGEVEDVPAPAAFDLIVLRPFGLAATAFGAALCVPATLLTAIVHPAQIELPFQELVVGPAKWTFGDPLGTH
jgi:hypothetical protein